MKKILICDDSTTELTKLASILEQAQCLVYQAKNGEEALQLAKQHHPDLIFLDIVMPEMDGYAACRTMTKDPETKDIPIIFVSSKGAKADRIWAQMQGAKELIQKPYQDTSILEQVNAL